MYSLEDKRALVTGASGGIGEAIVNALARAGADVALLARDRTRLEAQATALSRGGRRSLALPADVTREEEVRRAVSVIQERWGGLDILVLCAGVTHHDRLGAEDTARALRTVDVNLGGTIRTLNAVLPLMLAQGSGRIVGIASLSSFRGLPGSGVYAGSKAGMTRLLESLRAPCRARGVFVSTVHPGFVDTPMTADYPGRPPFLVSPERVAEVVVRVLRTGRRERTVPWTMAALARIARWLPPALFDRVAARQRQ